MQCIISQNAQNHPISKFLEEANLSWFEKENEWYLL